MSLIGFHRILIASAIVFCAGFAAWEFVAYSRDGGTGTLLIGVAFAAGAVLLGVYLAHLKRVLRLRDGDGADGGPTG